MLCINCGRDCAKQFTKKIDGREVKLTLCPDCYARLYPEQDEGFFTSFVGRTESRKKTCPVCGTALDDYRRTGLLGCAHCYAAFREELLPTIRYIQGKTSHGGKAPSGAADETYDLVRDLVREREVLKGQIDEAEKRKDESALRGLRARLAEINRKLYQREGDL